MTDLFVGEILVLVLLFPVLLRPFLRRLQRISGLALFPLLAFLLCIATIAGGGLKISFFPILLFSLLVLVAGFGRLFRLFRQLPTDWYSPSLMVFNGFLLLVFFGVIGLTFYTAPEAAYISRQNVVRSSVQKKIAPGDDARILFWTPAEGTAIKGIVLFEGDIAARADSRATMATVFAENGYKVIAADFRSTGDYLSPVLYFSSIRSWLALSSRIFPGVTFPASPDEIFGTHLKNFTRLIELVGADKTLPLYAVAEGSACRPLVSRMIANPGVFAGAVCILNQDQLPSAGFVSGSTIVIAEDSGMMPSNAGSFPVCVLTGSHLSRFGTGELACDDILSTVIAGGSRDRGRKQAEVTARRISSWIAERSGK